MFKIKSHVIAFDKKLLNEIKNLENNPYVKKDLEDNAKSILENSRYKIPYNVYSFNAMHLRDLYYVKEPKRFKTKIDGTSVNSWRIEIAPKGRYKTYYGVVTAGVRLGTKLKYSDNAATNYPIHKTAKTQQNKIKQDFINGLKRKIEEINGR